MSAERLREAARLIRERAEGADTITLHRPWGSDGEQVVGGDGGWMLVATTLCQGTDTVIAAHIASWHPAVALAVADWLDAYAEAAEAEYDVLDPHALAVADAYLGGA